MICDILFWEYFSPLSTSRSISRILREDVKCQVKYVDESLEDSLSPALYLTSPIDDYKDNVVYLNQSEDYDLTECFSTIAHESYPGHLYQNAYFSA